MANYSTHLLGGGMVSSALVGACWISAYIPAAHLGPLLFLGILGSILPDIDADRGKPVTLVFKTLAWLCLIPFIFLAWKHWGNPDHIIAMKGWSIKEFFMFGIGLWVFVRYVAKAIFSHLTVHRGIFHSIPMGLFFSSLTSLIYTSDDSFLRLVASGFIFAGYITHLLLDELWSINLTGVSVKKSFGTALKPFGTPMWKGLVLYFISGLIYAQTITAMEVGAT